MDKFSWNGALGTLQRMKEKIAQLASNSLTTRVIRVLGRRYIRSCKSSSRRCRAAEALNGDC